VSNPVLVVTGSPSDTSRSTLVARRVADELGAGGVAVRFASLRDFDAADVLFARTAEPRVAAFVEAARVAPAIVLATPVYKATYSGGLKALVDLIPPEALAGKPVLAIATTRLDLHGPLVARAFDALFAFFDAVQVCEALVLLDAEIVINGGAHPFAAAAEARVTASAAALLRGLSAQER
jgi:FMN reductase